MKVHLSSTSSSDSQGRTALRAIGLAVVLVAALDLLSRAVLPRGWLLDYEDFVRQRVESEPAPAVQVVGDSVARSGVLMSGLTGGLVSGRNDAIPAGGTPKTYLLLARQFEAGHVPKALVIAHSPHTLGQIRYEVLVGSFADWREVPELLIQSDPWTDALYGVFTRFSYLLMHRDSFADLIRRGDASFFTDKTTELALPPDEKRLARFHRDLASGEFSWSKLAPAKTGAHSKPFEVKPMNDHYMRRILKLARAHDVKVFWVTPPFPGRVIEARAETDYESRLLEYLGPFESRGELTILRGGFTEYPDEMFRDDLHLNTAGAVRFACELGALREPVVRAALGGSSRSAQGATSSAIVDADAIAMLESHCRAMQCPASDPNVRSRTPVSYRSGGGGGVASCRHGTVAALKDGLRNLAAVATP